MTLKRLLCLFTWHTWEQSGMPGILQCTFCGCGRRQP